ncbi:MAG TPA: PstS family phosphate ABC transporter substrate-binding protein [Candidatus Baltobacteraceae bacterium]|nr:PstS family phosphate ABC transporter substrate-binding protein [Candidatus Baltobacteraceae bacterium]
MANEPILTVIQFILPLPEKGFHLHKSLNKIKILAHHHLTSTMKISLRNLRVGSATAALLRTLPVALMVALASCSPSAPKQITIRGSNTFGEELAPKLIAEFKKDHPQVAFDTEYKGTPYGFGALMVDKCDIAAASREVSKDELSLAKDRDIAFNTYPIGTYSVAVILNAGNSLTNLTLKQVHDLFTGKAQNWKDVGGPDAPVHLYIRDPISGTYLGFQELAMDKDSYAQHPKTFTNYTGIVQAVAQDPAGIGYASVEDTKKPGIKGVAIGGQAPTPEAVQKGQYPYARLLRLYTNKAREEPLAMDFIHFIQSERGQKVMSDMGFVPHS